MHPKKCCSTSVPVERPRWSCFMSYGGSWSVFCFGEKARRKSYFSLHFYREKKSQVKGQSDDAISSDMPAYFPSIRIFLPNIKE
ncbi:hypothetical protein TNIN_357001 [Trichonephila inaurata madagascariensis]|uniref:Uncharacterized protein n=1 Tax=Trichonephila inaurata madagascariensis TaxID=2747483 RepID=A0A8X7CGS9_9ARAC|nr:hypothetical protein TNIN_357001 [Trichonephila inaurata madagascariensis]